MSPWPIAWTTWSGKLLKIIEVENTPVAVNQYKPGQVFLNNGHLTVQCGINGLIIKRLQLEGKTEMQAEEFLRGQKEFSHALLT
jgi:methionyl-tRNA formyltransferase